MPRKPAQPQDPIEPAEPVGGASPEVPPTVPPPVPAAAAPTEAIPAPAAPSFLERLRRNRMGTLTAALTVAVIAGLLLAILVPSTPQLYATVLLGLLLTAAVGFTVRYLAADRGLRAQGIAFLATALGVHVMAITGAIDGSGAGELLEIIGAEGPGFDDALLAALATPAVSAGGVLAGLVAAIVAGWGPHGTDEVRER